MTVAAALVLLVTGVIHLLPLTAVRSGAAVARLYGVSAPDAGTALLLRHRAVLLALVGVVLVVGAFVDEVRALAVAVGLASTASYVLLGRNPASPELRRVRAVDLGLIALLVVAAVLVAVDMYA